MLVDLSLVIKQVTVSVTMMQFKVSATHVDKRFCGKYVDDNFADWSYCCNYAGELFFYTDRADSFK